MTFTFNLSPERVPLSSMQRDYSFLDTLGAKREDRKAGEAAAQAAQGLSPDQVAQVTPLLRNAQTRDEGLRMIREWRKPKEYGVQIAPDGTPLRIDEQAGTVEAIGARGQYARPRDTSVSDRNTPEARAAAAKAQGLQEGTPEFQRYVLTGTLPASDRGVTAGDREAIRDADDAVMSGENTLTLIKKAQELSGKAYDGPTASLRGRVSGAFGDESGQATLELNNVVTEQALGQLKSIFGAAPTEGERQILLEIQGSADQPKAVRDAILQRAYALVERRVKYNQDRAAELRGGDYYKPRAPQGQETPSTPKRLKFNPATGDFE